MRLSLQSLATSILLLAPYCTAFTAQFPYGSTKVRGVNLGGWLVLEPWITPSLFDNTGDNRIIDEYTYGQFRASRAALVNHWNTWITEDDFKQIAAAGLNHVRIPIGYWAYEILNGEPYYQGQLPYLQRAVDWARNNNLKVIVDLHGAPGSQNGFDNSGQKLDKPLWHTQQRNVDRTNAVIKRIADAFKNQADVVSVIAPLNEPAGFHGADLLAVTKQYWNDSYGNIRFSFGSSQESNNLVLISDAFQPLSYWNGFQSYPGAKGVAMDKHIYQMFSPEENARSNQEHIRNACDNYGPLNAYTTLWVIIGEWTAAATDCAKYLNGRGVGSRYDGSYPGTTGVGSCQGLTGRGSSFSSAYKTFLRQYWEAQTSTFEAGAIGWTMWTWKAEIADEWTYQAGLAYGWIPRNPTERRYPNICA